MKKWVSLNPRALWHAEVAFARGERRIGGDDDLFEDDALLDTPDGEGVLPRSGERVVCRGDPDTHGNDIVPVRWVWRKERSAGERGA